MRNYKTTFLMLFLSFVFTSSTDCGFSSDRLAIAQNTTQKPLLTEDNYQPKQVDDLVFSREGWIYFLPASKKAPQRIAQGDSPSLNTQKKQIVYIKPQFPEIDAEAVLMLFDITTNKTQELYRLKGSINTPRFEPEGDLVLFTWRTLDGKTKLEVINMQGEESLTINETNQEINDIFSPAWAADGKSIYFHDMTNLFHVSFDGQMLKKTPLTKITGRQDVITSSDKYIPSPKDTNLLLFTQLVPGNFLFDKTRPARDRPRPCGRDRRIYILVRQAVFIHE
jgi:hypothetical protein